jgi:hypothetical protein
MSLKGLVTRKTGPDPGQVPTPLRKSPEPVPLSLESGCTHTHAPMGHIGLLVCACMYVYGVCAQYTRALAVCPKAGEGGDKAGEEKYVCARTRGGGVYVCV